MSTWRDLQWTLSWTLMSRRINAGFPVGMLHPMFRRHFETPYIKNGYTMLREHNGQTAKWTQILPSSQEVCSCTTLFHFFHIMNKEKKVFWCVRDTVYY